MTTIERLDKLERQVSNLQHELALARKQLDAQVEICEGREKRLRSQMNGEYQPCEGMASKTAKEPVAIAAFHRRVTRAET